MANRWKVLALVSAAAFLVGLDMFIVNLAFPEIQRSMGGADVATLSWVLNGYTIVLAALMVVAGRVADRSGIRRVFLIGLVLFGLGSALCGVSVTIEMLIASRVIQAVGAAALLPTSLALLLPEFEPPERPRAIGIWAAVGALAAAFGPPVGGLLVEVSWRLVFYVNLPIVAVAIVLGRRMLRESRDASQRRPDLTGAGLLTAAVALVALGFVKAPAWGWVSAPTLAVLASGFFGIALFWVRCHMQPSPVVDPALLRVRSYALANSAAFAFSAAFSAMLLATVLFLTTLWHYSALRAGFGLTPGPLTASAFAVLGGRFLNRAGPRTLGAVGALFFAAGCAWWLWRAGAAAGYAAELLPGLLITGVGVGLLLPSLTSAAAASLPPQRFATGSAVFTMSRQLGFVLGVAILVALLGRRSAGPTLSLFQNGWTFMIIAAVISASAALGIGKLRRHSAPEHSGATQAVLPEPITVEQSGA